MAKATTKTAAKTANDTATTESDIKAYELMFILQPELRESEVKKKLTETEDFITKAGGKVTHTDLWGKEQMAYNIKGHSEGIYVVYNLELPTNVLGELDEHLRLEKDVIRHMVVTLPGDYKYIKYEDQPEEEKAEKEEKPERAPKKSVAAPRTVTKKEVKEPETPKDAGVAPDKSALDDKLDAIIGGDDLEV